MPLSAIPLADLSEAHVRALTENAVAEGRRIEFKESVGGRDEDKREFLADVSSFANAAGGDLLVGVSDENGLAAELKPVIAASVDSEVLRFENMIRDGIQPRIPGIAIQSVPMADGSGAVLVIRIPRSWAAPHMVTFRGHSRFYSRNSAGKYPLDVAEIRAAFIGSETGRARLQSWRSERLGRIVADDGPIQLEANPKTVLHLIPVSALDATVLYDVSSLVTDASNFWPLVGNAANHRINFDGAVTWAPWGRDEPSMAYTQVFRTGAIEGVEAYMLSHDRGDEEPLIPSVAFEDYLIKGLGRYLALAMRLEVTPPYVVALSLLDVRGVGIAVSQRFFDAESVKIDRDNLVIPETVIEDVNAEPHTVLRPLFDAVWNAVGWRGSPYYTDDGKWQPPG